MAIYHKITKCPKCRGELWCVDDRYYKCDKCGRIDFMEAVEILHGKIQKAKRSRKIA